MILEKQSTMFFSAVQKLQEKQFIYKLLFNIECNKCEEDAITFIGNIINEYSDFTIFLLQPNELNKEQCYGLSIENNILIKKVNICEELNSWIGDYQKKFYCKKLLEQKFIQLNKQQSNQTNDESFLQENKIQFKQFKKIHFQNTYNLIKQSIPKQSQFQNSKYYLMKFFCKNTQNSQFSIFYQKGLKIISYARKQLKKTIYHKDYQVESLYYETINFLESLAKENRCSWIQQVDGLLI